MAISVVGTPTSLNYAARTTSSFTKPTGAAAGDLAVVIFEFFGGIFTSPPDYTWDNLVDQDQVLGGVLQSVWYKVLDGTEGSTFDFTTSAGSTTGECYVLRGADKTAPLVPLSTYNVGSGASVSVSGFTTLVAGCFLIFVATGPDNATVSTPPTGFTSRYNPGGTQILYVADQTQSSAGATGTVSVSLPGNSTSNSGALFAVQPDQSANAVVSTRDQITLPYASRTNPNWSLLTTPVLNDLLLLIGVFGISGTSPAAPTLPSGFAAVTGFPQTITSLGFTAGVYAYYKYAGASESGSYTFTGSFSCAGTLYCLKGVDQTTPVEASSFAQGTGTAAAATSITSTVAGDLIIAAAVAFNNSAQAFLTPTADPILRDRFARYGAADAFALVDGRKNTAGATGSQTINLPNNTTSPWGIGMFAVKAASGSSSYNATLAETGTAADTVSSLATFLRAVAEVGAAVDAVSSLAIFPRSVAETGAAAETVGSVATFARSVTEAGTAAETVGSVATFARSVTEAGSAVDALTGGLLFLGALAEAGSAVDTESATATYSRSLTEAGSAAETLSALASFIGALAEAGIAVDSPTSLASFIAGVVEAANAVDSPGFPAVAVDALVEAAFASDTFSSNLSYNAAVAEVCLLVEDFLSTTAFLDGSADRIVYALTELRIVYSVDGSS